MIDVDAQWLLLCILMPPSSGDTLYGLYVYTIQGKSRTLCLPREAPTGPLVWCTEFHCVMLKVHTHKYRRPVEVSNPLCYTSSIYNTTANKKPTPLLQSLWVVPFAPTTRKDQIKLMRFHHPMLSSLTLLPLHHRIQRNCLKDNLP